jgi:transposase-like protein
MDEDSLKVLLARGLSVEEIGRRYERNASTVAYWMRKYGLEASDRGARRTRTRSRSIGNAPSMG